MSVYLAELEAQVVAGGTWQKIKVSSKIKCVKITFKWTDWWWVKACPHWPLATICCQCGQAITGAILDCNHIRLLWFCIFRSSTFRLPVPVCTTVRWMQDCGILHYNLPSWRSDQSCAYRCPGICSPGQLPLDRNGGKCPIFAHTVG